MLVLRKENVKTPFQPAGVEQSLLGQAVYLLDLAAAGLCGGPPDCTGGVLRQETDWI